MSLEKDVKKQIEQTEKTLDGLETQLNALMKGCSAALGPESDEKIISLSVEINELLKNRLLNEGLAALALTLLTGLKMARMTIEKAVDK